MDFCPAFTSNCKPAIAGIFADPDLGAQKRTSAMSTQCSPGWTGTSKGLGTSQPQFSRGWAGLVSFETSRHFLLGILRWWNTIWVSSPHTSQTENDANDLKIKKKKKIIMIRKSMYSEMDLVSFRLEAKIASLQKDLPNGFTLQSLSPKSSLSNKGL